MKSFQSGSNWFGKYESVNHLFTIYSYKFQIALIQFFNWSATLTFTAIRQMNAYNLFYAKKIHNRRMTINSF